jgi:predicted regulator of Ras-like GTPase activity (Roadblock/LC7/MglB family)
MNAAIESRSSLSESAWYAARSLMGDIDGVRAALIASSDGAVLAHAGRLPVDAARLAAMGSSLSALGDEAALETGVGDTRYLVVEAGNGRILVRRLKVNGTQLVAVLLTDKSVLLGMAWSRIGQVEQAMNAE